MDESELTDNELEEELEKDFTRSSNIKNVFEIMRNEESSLEIGEKKLKFKKKELTKDK